MSLSTELNRFMTDHAKPEDLAAFKAKVRSDADATAVSAAMNAQGYSVTADELLALVPQARQLLATIQKAMPAATARNVPADVNQQALFSQIEKSSQQVKDKLNALAPKGDAISVLDMFEMQMLMNHMSQLCEMVSSVASATNSAMSSMTRNIKG